MENLFLKEYTNRHEKLIAMKRLMAVAALLMATTGCIAYAPPPVAAQPVYPGTTQAYVYPYGYPAYGYPYYYPAPVAIGVGIGFGGGRHWR